MRGKKPLRRAISLPCGKAPHLRLATSRRRIDRLKLVGDEEAANALDIIMTDEIIHVSVGKRWFDYACGMDRFDPVST